VRPRQLGACVLIGAICILSTPQAPASAAPPLSPSGSGSIGGAVVGPFGLPSSPSAPAPSSSATFVTGFTCFVFGPGLPGTLYTTDSIEVLAPTESAFRCTFQNPAPPSDTITTTPITCSFTTGLVVSTTGGIIVAYPDGTVLLSCVYPPVPASAIQPTSETARLCAAYAGRIAAVEQGILTIRTFQTRGQCVGYFVQHEHAIIIGTQP
jgi:hypothetical protein